MEEHLDLLLLLALSELRSLLPVLLAGPQDPPIGRRNGAFALDPLGHRLLVWGGTADGATAFPGLYALDLDRGREAWHRVTTEGAPTVRAAGGAGAGAAPVDRCCAHSVKVHHTT